MKEVSDKIIDNTQMAIGYGTSIGLSSTPLWVQNITTWLELFALILGIAVGITTIHFNIVRTKALKNGNKRK